jgi:transcriptional regulator with XRE-family HTH domain
LTEDMMNEPTPTVVQWITITQAQRGMSDADLALLAGIAEPALRLMKQGKLKLPTSAVKGLARAFQVDARELLDVVLSDYMPDLHALIAEIRMPLELTDNERELLKRYRRIANGRNAVPVVVSGITLVFPKSM